MDRQQAASGNRSARNSLLRLTGTLLALVLLWLMFRRQDQGWEELVRALSQLSWPILVGVVLLMLGSRLAVSGRWHVLLRSGGVSIHWMQTMRITFAGLFMSNFLPTTIGGDVARLAGALRLGYDRAVSLASLVVDRLVGMAGMGMAALELLFFLPQLQSWLAGIMQTAPVGFALASFFERASQKGQRAVQRLWQALGLWLGWGLTGEHSVQQKRRGRRGLLAALAFTWVHMLCTFGILWILLRDMGEPLPFALVSGLWAVTYFITLVPVSINGLGVQELSITFLFTSLGGVSASAGLTLALFMRLLPMLASLPGALFLPGIMAGDAVDQAQRELQGSRLE